MKQGLSVFGSSFSTGMRQWRVAVLVYFFQLCLAFTIGMQVFDVLKASIGHSLEINKLLLQYDHTVLTDFLKIHGASITPLIGQLRWLLLAWIIFSVFINAGMLYCSTNHANSSLNAFWQGAAAYFFRFGKISLVFLLLIMTWSALMLIPMAVYLEPSLEYFSSEKYTVGLVLVLLTLYLFGLALLYLWSIISRLLILTKGGATLNAVKSAGKTLWNQRFRYIGLLAGFFGLQCILVLIYWILEAYTGMVSAALICLFFLIQQVFIFFRIQLKQMLFTGMARLTTHSTGSSVLPDGRD